jgi:hypothetical protein
VVDPAPTIDRPAEGTAFAPGITFYAAPSSPVDPFPSYGYQQVFGSASGRIVFGPTVENANDSAQEEPVGRGIELLMVRQRSVRGRPLASVVTDAYLDVASSCSSTGCTVTRLSEDRSLSVSHVAACHRLGGFTCVPFFVPTLGRVIGGAYNVTFWGPETPGTTSGVVFGSGCSGDTSFWNCSDQAAW